MDSCTLVADNETHELSTNSVDNIVVKYRKSWGEAYITIVSHRCNMPHVEKLTLIINKLKLLRIVPVTIF